MKEKGNKSSTRLFPVTGMAVVCICILTVVAGCIATHPSAEPEETIDWNLTLVGNKETVLTFDEIRTMPSYTGHGGFFTTVGIVNGPFKCKGIPLEELCDLVGGIDESNTVWVSAPDGYMMVFDYDQIKGDFNTFNPENLREVPHGKLTMILEYEQDGEILPENDGRPYRIAIVGKEELLTEGSYWVKWVDKIEIRTSSNG